MRKTKDLQYQRCEKTVMSSYLISALILLSLIFFSCGQSKEEKAELEEEKLEKDKIRIELSLVEQINKLTSNIFSSIEVGLNFLEYSNMLRDLKSEIDYVKQQITTKEANIRVLMYADILNSLMDAHSLWSDEIEHANMHNGFKAIMLETISYKDNRDDGITRDIFNKYLSEIINRYDLSVTVDEKYIEATNYTIITHYLYSRPAIAKIWQEAANQYASIK